MLTPEEAAAVANADDGWEGWVTIRVRTDGGSLRVWPDGDVIDGQEARDLVWDMTTVTPGAAPFPDPPGGGGA